ncbi:MAG: xanthine dehydrogenase family protein subunit M [Rhodobacteraceae bacterium]|nr:xanthine dehydrogenase family protein subunit M [Paracoccaceae bacterium]
MVEFYRPENLQDALAWLASEKATIAAGCTDLFAATERQELAGKVIDITGLTELAGISANDEGWRIGAKTSWSELIAEPLPAAFDGLKAAAKKVGSGQIQNTATIVGNICNASPAADGVPALLTLDAEIEVMSASGRRWVPLQSFITGPRQIACEPGELVTAIHVPARCGHGQSGFFKLGARKYLVISIAMVAVRLTVTDGTLTDVAIAVGACSPIATRLPELESALNGVSVSQALNRISPDLIVSALTPIDDIRADREYRLIVAVEVARRTIAEVLQKSAGETK